MNNSEQALSIDASPEPIETSSTSEELDLEDDLTAILRAKDALIKQKNIEANINDAIIKQKDESIAQLRSALELADQRFTSIYLFSSASSFTTLSPENYEGVCSVLETLANDAVADIQKVLISVPSPEIEKITPNREG